MKQTGYDMLYLTACALQGRTPEADRVAAMDLAKLYRLAEFHSLTAMVCMALESAGTALPKEWMQRKGMALRKNILLDAERAAITGFMEENGIWYMPLKGVILKELYPNMGMRQMADNDILYDAAFQTQMRAFLQQRGYRAEVFGKGNHDVYLKPPVYNFELHGALFGEHYREGFHRYYADVKDRLVKDEGNDFGYHFTDEDFYIYFTAHASKHYMGGGTGLRTLVDCQVYLAAKGDGMDWAYIERECETLGIAEFERCMRALSEKVFGMADAAALEPAEREMLDYCLFSGTYGTVKHRVAQSLQKLQSETGGDARGRYLLHRLFPPLSFYQGNYPFFYRHKWLLPIGWLYRLGRGLCRNRRRIAEELHTVMDTPREGKS